ncbi:DNA polymerase III subunit epsilon [Rubrivivax gelatinosus]|uniref:DNA-directed DNA polymerase n=1 Tax=Rubrivivax gelatinosus TaxID=28068 RepID=A0ABS1DSN0_RUBGE|nr:exonuclease domain-containing protein [Rubrivivax gelatinosus]MBK1614128.1 DNA polymerase III subunit epsilon [Rubrivivax gelatinosus]MBK1711797.1 DNA polymerase III subunit epsilon [Rubrivivax gelatinosus]
MKPSLHEWAAALAPAALLAAAAALAALLLAATLSPDERAALAALLAPRATLLLLAAVLLAVAGGVWMRWAWHRFGAAPGRIAELLPVLLAGEPGRELEPRGGAGSRALAAAINTLLHERAAWRADVEARVQEASRLVEQEKSRLAALMAELTQSVVVCNLDGRILLYNGRARLQFRALSPAPAIGGAEYLGIGRSIYAVFDRALVAHALEMVQQRLQRGVPHPSAQFVTATRGGQLLRVQLAPVREHEAGPLAGFVLMLDNITRDFAEESERDRRLHEHTEAGRASLANLQAAVELSEDPALDAPTAARLQGVIRDEVKALGRRIGELAHYTTETQRTRWPLEDMQGADFVAAALRRIEALHRCRTAAAEVDPTLWLRLDSFSLIQALVFLAGRVVDEYGVKLVQLRLQRAGERAQLDLAWIGPGVSTETAVAWETEAMHIDGEASALTVRDVVQRHGGAFWFERERVRAEAFFRFLLPLADAAEPLDSGLIARRESRPEFYDFDLFQTREMALEMAERSLAELAYTVFDTETTGLEPSAGDEILQIGATRIVAGKLRRHESFEQLVDPQRSIPARTTAIHGISQDMVVGQPTIREVLPAFHAFVQDTVLVAHNAAFDLRFFELKERATGVSFDLPVLDTLLLSQLLHPNQDGHSLEAIAERLGVTVLGRHTALGDAIVTAEVFLKMLPLLQARGIRTLGQALEASRQSALAKLAY